MRRPSLFIFGIDGAPHGLVKTWMDAGWLPNLKAFAASADTSRMRCTWPPHTASGWTSAFTGRLPGEHGHYEFWRCQAADYGLYVTERQDAGVRSMWDLLVEHGRSVGLMNLPMSHPPAAWPGYQFTWPLRATLHYTDPPGLAAELRAAGGLSLPDIACMYDGRPGYLARALRFVEGRLRSARRLLETRPTDVMAVVFTEADRVMHHYWHAMDPAHPGHASAAEADRTAILQVFQAIDAAFGELLDLVGDMCNVLVLSDHGFGPGTRDVRIHEILRENGFATYADGAQQAATGELDDVGGAPEALDLEWPRTLAYMPTPGSFALNLNLAGRQRDGIVTASDRQRLIDDLSACLLEQRGPEGARLFRAVVPAEVAYPGPHMSDAPDLLLVPTDASLMVSRVLGGPTFTPATQPGIHRLDGVAIYRSANTRARESTLGIETLAARMLADLGVDPGPGFATSTRPVEAFGLDPDAWETAPLGALLTSGPTVAPANVSEEPSLELTSDALIAERLRKMGYL